MTHDLLPMRRTLAQTTEQAVGGARTGAAVQFVGGLHSFNVSAEGGSKSQGGTSAASGALLIEGYLTKMKQDLGT